MGGLQRKPTRAAAPAASFTGSRTTRCSTDIDVPGSYYKGYLRRQAVVNTRLTLNFTDEKKDLPLAETRGTSWCYEHGIADYVPRWQEDT